MPTCMIVGQLANVPTTIPDQPRQPPSHCLTEIGRQSAYLVTADCALPPFTANMCFPITNVTIVSRQTDHCRLQPLSLPGLSLATSHLFSRCHLSGAILANQQRNHWPRQQDQHCRLKLNRLVPSPGPIGSWLPSLLPVALTFQAKFWPSTTAFATSDRPVTFILQPSTDPDHQPAWECRPL